MCDVFQCWYQDICVIQWSLPQCPSIRRTPSSIYMYIYMYNIIFYFSVLTQAIPPPLALTKSQCWCQELRESSSRLTIPLPLSEEFLTNLMAWPCRFWALRIHKRKHLELLSCSDECRLDAHGFLTSSFGSARLVGKKAGWFVSAATSC